MQAGEYVTFHYKDNGDLVMSPTQELLDSASDFDRDSLEIWDLLEDYLCNGWEFVDAEHIGALTSAPIISPDVIWSDSGELESIESAYGYMDYAVFNPATELLHGQSITWQKG